jgi:cyanophycinase-like exopeptidase
MDVSSNESCNEVSTRLLFGAKLTVYSVIRYPEFLIIFRHMITPFLKGLLVLGIWLGTGWVQAQSYSSYMVGDTADITTATLPGTVLMGGAGDNDDALTWMLTRSGGGDIVVLRASGSDGYNDYLYSDLGVAVNSVETIVFNTAAAATDPYVIARIEQAEALWIAGGDQWDYISYWRDTPVETAINYLINEKQVPVGGTSAGMAIQGQGYFSAENGTVTSAQALMNPYANAVTIGYDDFIENPALQHIITDTHFDNPDRKGRLVAFMARLYTDQGIQPFAIACEEFTAVCIDENGIATVFGEYPAYDDFAWFVQVNCEGETIPEVCEDGEKLTWNRDAAALKVIKAPGRINGEGTVDLNDWKTITGADVTWENWWVEDGSLELESDAAAIDCSSSPTSLNTTAPSAVACFPNPAHTNLQLFLPVMGNVELMDLTGSVVYSRQHAAGTAVLPVNRLSNGIYILRFDGTYIDKVVIQH